MGKTNQNPRNSKSLTEKREIPLKNTDVSIIRKKNGRPPSASGYSTSNLIALLDIVKAILLIMDFEWQLMVSYFSKNYVEKYKRSIQNDIGLKMKFRFLCRGPSTRGGQKLKYEKKAKKIQK
jgi:hypothetical protein